MSLQTLKTVSSTMDVARENALAGRVRFDAAGYAVPRGVRAEEQTAGRGQRGREWFAQADECLCATYYVRLGMETPERAGQLAFVAGVAVVETLEAGKRKKGKGESTGSFPQPSTLNPQPEFRIGLKWPNDALLNGRKVGGILIELVQAPVGEWIALVGVGVNVGIREFPVELAGVATSLWREGVEDCDINQLAEAIGSALEHFADVWRGAGFEAILAQWRRYDATPGRIFTTTIEGRTVQGTAEGIDVDGALQLRLENGSVLRVLSASSLQEKAVSPPSAQPQTPVIVHNQT